VFAHFADELFDACEAKGGPVCVGLDPVYGQVPRALTVEHGDAADPTQQLEAIRRFCEGVLEAVADEVPCVKLQLGCFERYGAAGWAVYEALVKAARERGLIVIADGKRGDIGTSSAHYAAGLLGASGTGAESGIGGGADALTVNPYVGTDGLEPFVEAAAARGKGLFALVRTSNPGAEAIQAQPLADGRVVCEAVADEVATLGRHVDDALGRSGYSHVGAVVGATKPGAIASLRRLMPQQVLLLPGVGAQGGSGEKLVHAFDSRGRGALVTASRSVIYAFPPEAEDWQSPIQDAARGLRQQVAAVAGSR